jgi:hypothetical protein
LSQAIPLEPDQALAISIGLDLIANDTKRKSVGYRLKAAGVMAIWIMDPWQSNLSSATSSYRDVKDALQKRMLSRALIVVPHTPVHPQGCHNAQGLRARGAMSVRLTAGS